MDEDGRAVRSRRRRVLIGAGAGVALLAVGGSAWALSGGSGHPPAARPVPTSSTPASPTAAPSAGTAAPASPAPSASPSASPAATPSRAPSKAATPAPRATKKPRTQVSPGTNDPQNDGGSTTRNGNCATNPAGEIMTCGPVRTGTPLPR
ncbi:hypothetical protein [Kitasatospora sp. NPDC051914]|uniref:hypothetical protein n=1 Tax=Kitasatospora sp. NPDC051914 TaxID=3154945 RepID=UPI003439326C